MKLPGEVTINRFRWDIPIKIPPPDDRVAVRSIAWRTDEKILAIAYNNGLINLVDIESKDIITSLDVKTDIKSICWTQNEIQIEENDKSILNEHKKYLADLPNLNTITPGGKKMDYKSTKFYSKSMLNFLIVTCSDGKVQLYIYGVLKCGTIDIRKHVNATDGDKFDVLEVKLSADLKHLYAVYNHNGHIGFLIFENKTLLEYKFSLWKLSVKYGMIMNTLNYIEDTIEHINEAWESVLLEMDNKLAKYAKKQQPGAVSADFLELLMFGYPSESLEIFLTQEMTVRELKKLSNSVDMSYSTIQKLVVKPLHSAIVNLFYHINDVYGMQQNSYYYKGLLGEATNDPLMKTGSFLIKSHELQQTIDKSMKDYKIFFRWLYITISRLVEDTTPDDAAPLNQQEINYLAEFLYNFEEYRKETVADSGEKEIKFNLERVGQYLSPTDLLIPPQNDANNLWDLILAENECIRANKLIYPHNKKSSLISEKNAMRKSIDDIFERIETSIGSGFKLHSGRHLKSDVHGNEFKIVTSHFHHSDDSKVVNMFTILSLESDLLFVACFPDCEIKIAKLDFAESDLNVSSNIGQLSFIDVKFYSSKLISVFMKNEVGNKSHSCFFQLSVPRLLEYLNDHCSEILALNLFNFIDEGSFKSIDGFNGSMMAVSGSRKVASFLANNQKIVKLYELEVDEDDPDETDVSNNVSIEMN